MGESRLGPSSASVKPTELVDELVQELHERGGEAPAPQITCHTGQKSRSMPLLLDYVNDEAMAEADLLSRIAPCLPARSSFHSSAVCSHLYRSSVVLCIIESGKIIVHKDINTTPQLSAFPAPPSSPSPSPVPPPLKGDMQASGEDDLFNKTNLVISGLNVKMDPVPRPDHPDNLFMDEACAMHYHCAIT